MAGSKGKARSMASEVASGSAANTRRSARLRTAAEKTAMSMTANEDTEPSPPVHSLPPSPPVVAQEVALTDIPCSSAAFNGQSNHDGDDSFLNRRPSRLSKSIAMVQMNPKSNNPLTPTGPPSPPVNLAEQSVGEAIGDAARVLNADYPQLDDTDTDVTYTNDGGLSSNADSVSTTECTSDCSNAVNASDLCHTVESPDKAESSDPTSYVTPRTNEASSIADSNITPSVSGQLDIESASVIVTESPENPPTAKRRKTMVHTDKSYVEESIQSGEEHLSSSVSSLAVNVDSRQCTDITDVPNSVEVSLMVSSIAGSSLNTTMNSGTSSEPAKQIIPPVTETATTEVETLGRGKRAKRPNKMLINADYDQLTSSSANSISHIQRLIAQRLTTPNPSVAAAMHNFVITPSNAPTTEDSPIQTRDINHSSHQYVSTATAKSVTRPKRPVSILKKNAAYENANVNQPGTSSQPSGSRPPNPAPSKATVKNQRQSSSKGTDRSVQSVKPIPSKRKHHGSTGEKSRSPASTRLVPVRSPDSNQSSKPPSAKVSRCESDASENDNENVRTMTVAFSASTLDHHARAVLSESNSAIASVCDVSLLNVSSLDSQLETLDETGESKSLVLARENNTPRFSNVTRRSKKRIENASPARLLSEPPISQSSPLQTTDDISVDDLPPSRFTRSKSSGPRISDHTESVPVPPKKRSQSLAKAGQKSKAKAKSPKPRQSSQDPSPAAPEDSPEREQTKKRRFGPKMSSDEYDLGKVIKGFKEADLFETCMLHISQARRPKGIVKDTYHSDTIRCDITGTRINNFAEYSRDPKLCVVCKKPKNREETFLKCTYAHPDNPSCKRFVHTACAAGMNFGGYLHFHAMTCQGFCCPEHHCTHCFATAWHKPAFTTDDKLIRCFACASKYHAECIPAGCTVTETTTGKYIVCPRHYRTLKPKNLEKCFECDDKLENREKPLFKCSTCPKSFHATCHKVFEYKTGSSFGERCSSCFLHRFALVGDLVVVQYRGNCYHLARVVSQDVLGRSDPLLPGFCVIEYILKRSIPVYSSVAHVNLFPIKENTMFADVKFTQDMAELPRKMFDQHVSEYLNTLDGPRPEIRKYIHPRMDRNSLIRITDKSSSQVGNIRVRTGERVHIGPCNCETNENGFRCIPGTCQTNTFQFECLAECDLQGKCLNRFITNKESLFDNDKAEVTLTKEGYYGVKTNIALKNGDHIGEYCGEVVTDEQLVEGFLYQEIWGSQDFGFYTMELHTKRLDAQYFGSNVRYINHSCDPNCQALIFDNAQGLHVCISAMKNIRPGEELTFSYSKNIKRADSKKFKCNCGTTKCKGYFFA